MKSANQIYKYCFVISLFLHFFIVSGFAVNIALHQQEEKQKAPSLYIPSYVYQNPSQQTQPQPAQQESKPEDATQEVSQYGIDKKAVKKRIKHLTQMLPANLSKPDEPVHLIGEDKTDRPLLTLLGKALTKHLMIPKAALDFHVKGVAVIGFILSPDGKLTNIQLLKSSGAGILDQEALSAANAITLDKDKVSPLLKHPQFLVVGIIFG